jgi:predicted nucleic acid-binding protein
MKATVLDSYALISFLEREEGYDKVSAVLDECVLKDRMAYICVINWGEVIYHGYCGGGEKTARLAEDTLKALPIQVVDADKELTRTAAELKAFNKMSFADCFAAALAIKKKCELVTGDKEFRQVENKIKIRWIK